MTQNPLRACLVAGVSFALLAGASALAQDAPATKPAEPPAGQPGTRGAPPADGRQGGRQRAGGQGGPGGQGATSVEGAMKGMGRALKALEASISDPSKEQDSLKAIGDMERSCVMAKSMPLPADVRKEVTDPAERTKLGEAFHANLVKLLSHMVILEQNLLDHKSADAQAQLKLIVAMRDESHKTLGIKDE